MLLVVQFLLFTNLLRIHSFMYSLCKNISVRGFFKFHIPGMYTSMHRVFFHAVLLHSFFMYPHVKTSWELFTLASAAREAQNIRGDVIEISEILDQEKGGWQKFCNLFFLRHLAENKKDQRRLSAVRNLKSFTLFMLHVLAYMKNKSCILYGDVHFSIISCNFLVFVYHLQHSGEIETIVTVEAFSLW